MSKAGVLRICFCLALLVCAGGSSGQPLSESSAGDVRLLEYGNSSDSRPASGRDRIPCDVEIRYDDGTDETPGSAPALFWLDSQTYQALSVRFSTPNDVDHIVESAFWLSPAWDQAGWVDVVAYEVALQSNATQDSIWIDGPGTWGLEFSRPIIIPSGTDYMVKLCPRLGAAGLILDDSTEPDWRSAYGLDAGLCDPNMTLDYDLAVWSCVEPVMPVPASEVTWGRLKSIYR